MYLPCEMVQGTAQVVDGICGGAHHESIGTSFDMQPYKRSTGLRVIIKGRAVRIAALEGVDCPFYIRDVFLGPLDLKPRLIMRYS